MVFSSPIFLFVFLPLLFCGLAAMVVDVNVEFLPTVGPDINWDGGEMSIRYEMDKLNFDWRMEQMSFTFVPGDIEFTMTQRPDVIIKYVGGPLYVPPSADPDYKPVDVNA